MPCQIFRLIEATLATAGWVEWDWNSDVCIEQEWLATRPHEGA
jgi:hypothetical protein